MFRAQQEARERELARCRLFADTPKPADVSAYEWSNMTRYACCPEARARHCVCMFSYSCAKHGSRCVGTHD